jgi:Putative zinc-finger
MTCLDLERLYSYLDGGLAGRDKQAVEEHIAVCPACREALEERRHMLRAAETLPDLELPGDFAETILGRIPSAPVPRTPKTKASVWWLAAAAGTATFGVAMAATALLTGHSLAELLPALNRFLLSNFQAFASALAKGAKYVYLALKILVQLAGKILEALIRLTSYAGPEAQIVLVGATVLIVLGCAFLWNRRFSMEKNHED